MRSRSLALLVLIALIGLPFGLYWYFYKRNVSSLIFLPSKNDVSYTVTLDGKLEYKYFPLLDKAFHYSSVCTGSCIFSPVPPIRYALLIDVTGREKTTDTLDLKAGTEIRYEVKITELLSLEKYGVFSTPEAITSIEGSRIIGYSPLGKAIVLRNDLNPEIGIINAGKFLPIITPSISFEKALVDESRRYVIVPLGNRTSQIYPLDGGEGVIFPYETSVISVSYDETWKVRTSDGLYEYIRGKWQKNPRFTDFIDISPRYRIGYIDKSDTEKYILAGLPLGESLLILLDRSTGESQIIKKGIENKALFFQDGFPIFLDTQDVLWKLHISA